MSKSFIREFMKEDSVLAYVLTGVLVTRLLLVLASFGNIVIFHETIKPKTLYELNGDASRFFLILMFLDILFLLKKNEFVFVPAGLISNVMALFLTGREMENVRQHNQGLLTEFHRFLHTTFSGDYSVSPWDLQTTISYRLIRIFAFLGIALLILYLFFRIVRKTGLSRTPVIETLSLGGLWTAFSFQKLLSVSAVLLIVAPFLTYIRGDFTYYGFSSRPYAAFLAFLAGFFILIFLSKQSMKHAVLCGVIALLTVIRLNPFYILRYGGIGIGYVMYIAALILIVVQWVRDNLAKAKKRSTPV